MWVWSWDLNSLEREAREENAPLCFILGFTRRKPVLQGGEAQARTLAMA